MEGLFVLIFPQAQNSRFAQDFFSFTFFSILVSAIFIPDEQKTHVQKPAHLDRTEKEKKELQRKVEGPTIG